MEGMRRLPAGLLFCICALAQTRVWIDADTANEIDDLYAITRLLAAPELEIAALSSAHWSRSPAAEGNTVEASQRLNEALLGLAGRPSIPHPRGSAVGVYWWGADRAAYSAAAYHLIRAAQQMPEGQKLTVIALGALTNVASALMIEPSIAPKIRLYWLGAFIDTEKGVWDKSEFNCLNDIPALNEVLNRKDLELRVMPASVARALTFDYAETAERLARHGRLGEFLLARWKQHAPGASTWIMWDLAAAEWLLRPELVRWKKLRTPPENTPREVEAAVSIDAAAMRADFWRALGRLTGGARDGSGMRGAPRGPRSEAQADESLRVENVFRADAGAAEADALGLEAQPLLEGGFAAQADDAARAQNAVPGEPFAVPAQELHDQPVVQRVAGGGGHRRVGSHAAARDAADDFHDGLAARRILAPHRAAQGAFEAGIAALHTPQQ